MKCACERGACCPECWADLLAILGVPEETTGARLVVALNADAHLPAAMRDALFRVVQRLAEADGDQG